MRNFVTQNTVTNWCEKSAFGSKWSNKEHLQGADWGMSTGRSLVTVTNLSPGAGDPSHTPLTFPPRSSAPAWPLCHGPPAPTPRTPWAGICASGSSSPPGSRPSGTAQRLCLLVGKEKGVREKEGYGEGGIEERGVSSGKGEGKECWEMGGLGNGVLGKGG